MKERILKWHVGPEGKPIFDENSYTVEIEDESAGEFVTIEDGNGGKVSLEANHWKHLRNAINKAVKECR